MGCAIGAKDGEIGAVEDLYFDDQVWTIRYLIVATGAWLNRRKVLIASRSFQSPQLRPSAASRLNHQGTSAAQPRHRHGQAGFPPVRVLFISHYQHPCHWEVVGVPALPPPPCPSPVDFGFG